MKRKAIFKWIAFGLLVAAVAVPAAQSATRPDNRGGPLGASPAISESTAISSLRPNDRSGPLGVGQSTSSQLAVALRPDDRAGIRGVGGDETASFSLRPDDRAGIRGVGGVELAQSTGATGGFDWGDWSIGLAVGLFLALSIAAGLMAMQRSSRASDAAAAG
jgi:hypothetical protein